MESNAVATHRSALAAWDKAYKAYNRSIDGDPRKAKAASARLAKARAKLDNARKAL